MAAQWTGLATRDRRGVTLRPSVRLHSSVRLHPSLSSAA
ncbi:hypothetical protein TRIHO_16070 [Tritonibacter horizontis]|uniref:Uncharacterized protein n=1 Tax=Tritonibacter horizontis TaxID=1768241 RepID=A0A132BYP5_9RHOB|nr:hypothetical protein TRIHO_16070 [Tritonibacter horizontis]